MTDDHGPDCACRECRYTDAPPEAWADFVRGLIVIAGIGIIVALLLVARNVWGATATPSLRVLVTEPTTFYLPSGERITLPAGTEADLCTAPGTQRDLYSLSARVFPISGQCPERPLFRDGFEG